MSRSYNWKMKQQQKESAKSTGRPQSHSCLSDVLQVELAASEETRASSPQPDLPCSAQESAGAENRQSHGLKWHDRWESQAVCA